MRRMTGIWWWIDRWRKSTAFTDMTLEEQGAYRNLIDEVTLRDGPLPNDERILAKASGDARRWPKVRRRVLSHFTLGPDGCWHNATADEVRAKTREISDARSAAGQAGAQARWQTDGKRDGKRIAKGIAPDPYVRTGRVPRSGS